VDEESVSSNKKALVNRSKIKVLFFVFCDLKGIVHDEFKPRGQKIK
jgi:hypothetical protein